MPHASELVMVDLLGNENRNRTRLSDCRQYAGESVLTFVDAPVVDTAPPSKPKSIVLPAGLRVEVQLQTPIQSGSSAIGDAIQGVVSRDVKTEGRVVVPKGALLGGRITRLERRKQP